MKAVAESDGIVAVTYWWGTVCCGSCQFSSHDRPALHSSVLASIQSDKAGFWSCSSKYTSLGRKKCIEKKMMYVLDIGQIATSLSLTPYLTSPQRGCEDNRCALCHKSCPPHPTSPLSAVHLSPPITSTEGGGWASVVLGGLFLYSQHSLLFAYSISRHILWFIWSLVKRRDLLNGNPFSIIILWFGVFMVVRVRSYFYLTQVSCENTSQWIGSYIDLICRFHVITGLFSDCVGQVSCLLLATLREGMKVVLKEQGIFCLTWRTLMSHWGNIVAVSCTCLNTVDYKWQYKIQKLHTAYTDERRPAW